MARPTAGPGRSTSRPLAQVRARGSPSEGGGLVPSCFWIWLPFCLAEGHRDPRTHSVQGLFVREGGVFVCPLRPFFTRTFFPAPGFFGFSFGLRGPLRYG